MDERLRFVARLLDGEKMALCAEFGISRKTGYKIYDRYKDGGVLAPDGPESAALSAREPAAVGAGRRSRVQALAPCMRCSIVTAWRPGSSSPRADAASCRRPVTVQVQDEFIKAASLRDRMVVG